MVERLVYLRMQEAWLQVLHQASRANQTQAKGKTLMSDRPKHRFGKRSNKRFKRVRRIVRRMDAPEGVVLIPGRSVRLPKHIYVEAVRVDNTRKRAVRWYFDHKPTKKELTEEVYDLIGELT
jgi:hypothetical protein